MADAVALLGAASASIGLVDPDGMTSAELTDAILLAQRVRAQIEAAEARLLARWDADRVWQASGAKSGAAWLAREQRLPIQTTRQRIRHARALRTLPAVESAWSAGGIDRTHLITLLAVRTPRTRHAFDTDHKALLDSARTRGFVDFKRHCDRWEMLVDPDGAEQGAADDRAAREVHLSQSFGGMWFGRMTLDPVSGDIVHGTLVMIERELFEADWAEAKERLGVEPMATQLGRTPPSVVPTPWSRWPPGPAPPPRTASAPGHCSRCSSTTRPSPDPPRALQPHHDHPRHRRPLARRGRCRTDRVRRVLPGHRRRRQARRFFRGALRRAIEVRDRTCFHPHCDDVPERLQIDHIHDASKGGPTTQDNGQGGCGFHNRWKFNPPTLARIHPDQ